MSLVRKLKPDRSITGALYPLSMLPIFGIIALVFGHTTGLFALSIMIALFGLFYLYVYFRTMNAYLLVICAESGFLSLLFALMYVNPASGSGTFMPSPFDKLEYGLAYFTSLIFFSIVIVFLILTRKLKWRGREVFELAAEPIEETGNGYTPRPRPVGKVVYSIKELHDFARFCARHLIALPYISSKNITLVPIKMGDEFSRLLGLSGDYRDATWVNFDVSGEVSVHIAHKDYLEYREPLAFDQLCNTFGQVFIDFFESFKKGEGVRVVDRMDDLKIGILS